METKRKSPGNVECVDSVNMIKAEEHTRLTDKEERKTMTKRRMKTEIKHYGVDFIVHLDGKVYVLVFIYVSSINI